MDTITTYHFVEPGWALGKYHRVGDTIDLNPKQFRQLKKLGCLEPSTGHRAPRKRATKTDDEG